MCMTVWVWQYDGRDQQLASFIVLILYAILLLGIVYLIFAGNVMILVNRFFYGRFIDTIRVRFMASHRQRDEIRGDRPQPTNSITTKQSHSVKSFDHGTSLNENTFGTSGYVTASSNYSWNRYSDLSYKPSSPSSLPEPKPQGYNKSSYAVLIGDSVKVYSTNIFAALPSNNKSTEKSTEKDRYIISATVVATAMQKSLICLSPLLLGIHSMHFADLCMLITY